MLSDEFRDRISDDWLWREKEIRGVDALLLGSKDGAAVKAAILLMYSHWEGHFKECASELLEFICEGIKRKIFKWTDVRAEVRHRLLFCSYRRSSLAGQTHETFITYLNALNDARYASALSAKGEIIMIDDNLNALRAEAICRNLGVEYEWCALKKIIIDERLIEHRNAFAHGAKRLRTGDIIDHSNPVLVDTVDEVKSLIRETKDRFQNAITSRVFLEQ